MSTGGSPAAWLFPGQGSQSKGMAGEDLFDRCPRLVEQADEILGFSIREFCLADPEQKLMQTEFAQPALYVVNALYHEAVLDAGCCPPQYYAGHSLGEYNALQAAGCFDFAVGLRLVKLRGQLMSQARGGAMAAIIGLDVDAVQERLLPAAGVEELEIANINSPKQVVVSGSVKAIAKLAVYAKATRSVRLIPLAVSAAFHSRHMEAVAQSFARVLATVPIGDPRVPVVSNTTGTLFPPGEVGSILSKQMRSVVRWWDSLMTLRRLGVTNGRQIGPGRVISDLWEEARKVPVLVSDRAAKRERIRNSEVVFAPAAAVMRRMPSGLGVAFCERHGVRLPYASGSMYRGIASSDMVIRMGRAGLLGFFGAGGLTLAEVENGIVSIQNALGLNVPYGINLLASLDRPHLERALVDLYLRRGVQFIEAAAYMQLTEPLVEFRFRGAQIQNGRAHAPNQILAKISRAEVAKYFLAPPSEAILRRLLDAGRLSAAEAAAARRLPVSADVCVESDSGGHTDGGVALVLLPSMVRLRNRLSAAHPLDEIPRIGAAGGLGSPEAIAAAFVLGAEFVVTGSINQCTPEAGTSSAVKDLLAQVELHDTAYAPAGDMFELGSKVQVIKRGTLFPARANQLYEIYRTHRSLDALSAKTVATIERFMGRSLDDVWRLSQEYLAERAELPRVQSSEKDRMARVFKWYFWQSMQSALTGNILDRVNFQIHSGPAMGAFNAFARGSYLESWDERHVDLIAEELIARAEHHLNAKN